MKYNPLKDTISVTTQEAGMAAFEMLYAIQMIRQIANLPMDKYEQEIPMSDADVAQQRVVDAAKAMGLDLGAERANELDLREHC